MQYRLFTSALTMPVGIGLILLSIAFTYTAGAALALAGSATGLCFIFGWLSWKLHMRTPANQQAFQLYLQRPSNTHRSFAIWWTILLACVWSLLILTERLSETELSQKPLWHQRIIDDGGFWETLEALTLLLALAIYLWSVLRLYALSKWPSCIMIILFSLLLLCALGEETSWGQHWFGFSTPKVLKTHTSTGTLTLHKLTKTGMSLGQMANIAVHFLLITYGILLPLFAIVFADVRYVLDRIRLPTPHPLFALWPLLTLLLEQPGASAMLWNRSANELPWSLSEIRETILYLVFLGAVIYSSLRWRTTLL